MSLNLKDLLIWVAQHLDRARLVLFLQAREDGSSVVHDHDLGHRLLHFVAQAQLWRTSRLDRSAINFDDILVSASGIHEVSSSLLTLLLVGRHTSVVDGLVVVLPLRLLLVQLPHEEHGVVA